MIFRVTPIQYVGALTLPHRDRYFFLPFVHNSRYVQSVQKELNLPKKAPFMCLATGAGGFRMKINIPGWKK